MVGQEKSAEKDDETGKPNASSQGGFLGQLLLVYLFIVFGIPAGLALTFIVLGFSSVGYYGPPIGDVLSFLQRAVTVSATAATPLVPLFGFLYVKVPKFRRSIDRLLVRIFGEEQQPETSGRRIFELKPYMAKMRNALQDMTSNLDAPPPFHHRVWEMERVYEEMRRNALDVTLKKEAPRIWTALESYSGSLREIDAKVKKDVGDSANYWPKFAEELRAHGNLEEVRARLSREIDGWLDRHY